MDPRSAFHRRIMSDFGSTGRDVYALRLDGGTAANLTPAMNASATAIAWRCDGHLQAELSGGRPKPNSQIWEPRAFGL